jgi:hypothetical protein
MQAYNRPIECEGDFTMLNIAEYEKQFGRIPSPEELLDRHENMNLEFNNSSKTVYQ